MTSLLFSEKVDELLTVLGSSSSEILWITDRNTSEHCKPVVEQKLGRKLEMEYQIAPGENSKSWAELEALLGAMEHKGLDRYSLVVNLGGGVVSDLGGFAASIFHRGIDYVNIPTSLLAMCDAAIGGKTAINGKSKNQIGAFHLPKSVYLNTEFLHTLPASEFKSGMAELMKTLCLQNQKLKAPEIQADLDNYIQLAAQYKDAVCREDPRENASRIFLNIGHTIGHALEAWSHSHERPLSHGESVLLGLYYEHRCLKAMEWSSYFREFILESYEYLEKYPLPSLPELIEYMLGDKKRKNRTLKIPYLLGDRQEIATVTVEDFMEKLGKVWPE